MRDHVQFTIRDLVPWMIWTGIFCGIGWFLVGLPLASRGDRVLQRPVSTAFIVGRGGAAIMLVPMLVWSIPELQFKSLLNPQSWWFWGIAAVIAAVASALITRATSHLLIGSVCGGEEI